jgi:hypothetical protein
MVPVEKLVMVAAQILGAGRAEGRSLLSTPFLVSLEFFCAPEASDISYFHFLANPGVGILLKGT